MRRRARIHRAMRVLMAVPVIVLTVAAVGLSVYFAIAGFILLF